MIKNSEKRKNVILRGEERVRKCRRKRNQTKEERKGKGKKKGGKTK